ncbi:MAG: proline dehydrogenase family protein [Cyclobacteriaceae bacterium]|nr:proline dehydrogenase family protein [Cyclobacteriaceae bacterium]
MQPRNEIINFDDLAIAFSSKTDHQLKKANLIFTLINNKWLSIIFTAIVKFALKIRMPVKGIIRQTVFAHFCGGESIDDSTRTVEELKKYGIGTILDYSVEGEKTSAGFDKAMKEIIRTIDAARDHDGIPFSVFKMTGMASVTLLEKISSGAMLMADEHEAFERIKYRVNCVCDHAAQAGVPIMIDAEETWVQGPIDKITYEMMARYNKEKTIVFNTYQMYRTDSLKNLKEGIAEARRSGYYFGTKLVRGAYMEKERERAAEEGRPSPIHADKNATDQCFDDGLRLCFENKDIVSVMCGSHNEVSNKLLAGLIMDNGIERNDQRMWFSQLYGMSDNISFNLARSGFNIAKYVPYGPILAVMPYLFRRAEENTSVAGQSSRELQMIRKEIRRRKI